MTEISYITQNGQQINLKDAAGREMLAAKQNKLKAGNGISISADGTISATGGSSATKKIIAVCNPDDSGYAFVVNPQDFKTGKKYKATLYMPMLESDVDSIDVSIQIRQGGLSAYDGNYYHAGVSSWSPDCINIKNGGIEYGWENTYITINKDQLISGFNTETPIVLVEEFEYPYAEFGKQIRRMKLNGETNEYEVLGPNENYPETQLADYPEIYINLRNGNYNKYSNTCGCLRVEFEEVG